MGVESVSFADAASWAFSKAMGAYSIYTQWGAIKLSLKEAEIASQEALEAVTILGEKLANVSVMFVTSGVKDLTTKLQNGLLDMELFEEAFNRTTSNSSDGSLEVTEMMELFRSGIVEVERIANTSDSVIDLVTNIQIFTQQVSELTEAWVHVNMSWFEPLKNKTIAAKSQLHELNFAIERQCDMVRTLVQDYKQGMWNHTNATLEHIRAQVDAAVGKLGVEIDAFDTIFHLVIRPLVRAMVKGIRTLVESAEQYLLPAEAPDNAAEETISRWSCAWRSTRFFDAIDDVDIQRTMSCQLTILNQFKCSCIGRYDCYATHDYRLDPKETKRCFQYSWR